MIGGGADGAPADAKAISDLREKLSISESLMSEMTRSWEDKLRETERIHQARQKALEDMGISVQAAGIGVQMDKFYLVNLNADPSMNELLVCYLKVAGTIILYNNNMDIVMKSSTNYFPFNTKAYQFTVLLPQQTVTNLVSLFGRNILVLVSQEPSRPRTFS